MENSLHLTFESVGVLDEAEWGGQERWSTGDLFVIYLFTLEHQDTQGYQYE
jgi:hypothetical protein